MNNTQPTQHRLFPRYISWRTIILGLLALGTFLAISNQGGRYVTSLGRGMMEYATSGSGVVPPAFEGLPDQGTSAPGAPVQQDIAKSPSYYPYPYPSSEAPATDTREFLKVRYAATMRTRDVQGLTRRVATTVRGHAGRIDQESSSEQYGYVSFVVPQSKYDAFRTELESLVSSRFLTLSISSQNLLPQKLSIEEQQERADTRLADAQAARQRIVSAHVNRVDSFQAQIDADAKQLASLRAQEQTPVVQSQVQLLTQHWLQLTQQLANENSTYTAQLKNADANIKSAQDWQRAVQTKDQALLDNVATVTGTVSIRWIGLWSIVLLYLPGYWIPGIFALLTLFSFLWDKHSQLARSANTSITQ